MRAPVAGVPADARSVARAREAAAGPAGGVSEDMPKDMPNGMPKGGTLVSCPPAMPPPSARSLDASPPRPAAAPAGRELAFSGETLLLDADRVVLRPATGDLLLADPHFGKAATFRDRGIPVPDGAVERDLARLARHLSPGAATDDDPRGAPAWPVRRIVVLGDFFHAASSRSPEVIAALDDFRTRHPDVAWLLVRGNHDAHAGDPPASLGITCVDEPFGAGGIEYAHDPITEPQTAAVAAPRLCGHVHPVAVLRARGDRLRLPCFHLRSIPAAGAAPVGSRGESRGRADRRTDDATDDVPSPGELLLPAFGSFTGGHRIHPGPHDRIFLAGDGGVVEVPAAACGG